jgi:hypothetical protein
MKLLHSLKQHLLPHMNFPLLGRDGALVAFEICALRKSYPGASPRIWLRAEDSNDSGQLLSGCMFTSA